MAEGVTTATTMVTTTTTIVQDEPRQSDDRLRSSEAERVHILLVDDHDENLLALETVLEASDRVLVQAKSGLDALRALLRQQFAVILLDVNMPGLDGFETAAIIRQRPACAHTPIIFVTAHMDEAHVLRAYGLGAVDYILAPFSAEVLKAKVQVFVDLFRMTVENRRQAEQLRQAEALLRQQAERKLEEVNERLRLMIDAAVDYAIFSLDPSGHVAGWNAGAQRLFGYDESEIVGMERTLLFAPDETIDNQALGIRHLERAIAEGRSEVETWYRRKDGTRFFGNDTLAPIRTADGTLVGFTKVIRDITERWRANQALAQKAAELAEANRVKDEFLAVLSHELRTPLNAIVGWTQMLLSKMLNEADTERALQSIARNGKAQQALINDILDVSRFVTGKFRIVLAPVDLCLVLRTAAETAHTAAQAKGVVLDVEAPADPVMVNADADRVLQIAWNLLNNAVKFTPRGGTVRVAVTTLRDSARLAVQDNGSGIKPDFLPYVFDRFRQADSSHSRSQGGLGLGLAIVKHLVELHGGTVTAESEGEGKGATFTVTLPLLGPVTS